MLTPDTDTDTVKEAEITTNWDVKSWNSGKSFMEKMAFDMGHEGGKRR